MRSSVPGPVPKSRERSKRNEPEPEDENDEIHCRLECARLSASDQVLLSNVEERRLILDPPKLRAPTSRPSLDTSRSSAPASKAKTTALKKSGRNNDQLRTE